jgi:hypothetical protein
MAIIGRSHWPSLRTSLADPASGRECSNILRLNASESDLNITAGGATGYWQECQCLQKSRTASIESEIRPLRADKKRSCPDEARQLLRSCSMMLPWATRALCCTIHARHRDTSSGSHTAFLVGTLTARPSSSQSERRGQRKKT